MYNKIREVMFMNKYDLIIVGAGPSGVFTAYELISKNKDLKIAILVDQFLYYFRRRE